MSMTPKRVKTTAFCISSALALILLSSAPCKAQSIAQTKYAPWHEQDTQSHTTLPAQSEEEHDRQEETNIDSHQSRIEAYYSRRAGEELKQYGYDFFSQEQPRSNPLTASNAIQDDYILGSGDQIFISFNGQRSDQKYYTISMDGSIYLQGLPPLYANGLSLADLRTQLNEILKGQYNTQAYIALTAARPIHVLTIGHVGTPGKHKLSAFNNVIDALEKAGGITKQGSLRQIKLIRAGKTQVIDLYDLYSGQENAHNSYLQDGDRLIIPPIGDTFAITGAAKSPAIYEFPTQRHASRPSQMTLTDAIKLSGGALDDMSATINLLTPLPNGTESINDVTENKTLKIQNNSIINFKNGTTNITGRVELIGATTQAGFYDISRFDNLYKLLTHKQVLGDNLYPVMGVIYRKEKMHKKGHYLSYPIRPVLEKEKNINLKDGDTIILINNDTISSIYEEHKEPEGNTNFTPKNQENTDSFLLIENSLKKFLKEHIITIRGEVFTPGRYPISQGNTLSDVIDVAGGFTPKAAIKNIELTISDLNKTQSDVKSYRKNRSIIDYTNSAAHNLLLHPGDSVRVNPKDIKILERSVQIFGEVKRPGTYDIVQGDTLSKLLERAGGLSLDAYSAGAVFSRRSERKAEELRYRAAAQRLKKGLASALEHDDEKPNADQITLVTNLADQLATTETLGRISIEADPGILKAHPEYDILLEDGDKLYIPKRPMSVKVTGEVLSPANLPYREGKDARDYIKESGGVTYHADKERSFVLYPDGTAAPLAVSSWSYSEIMIPPGSTIIVPRDPKPFSFLESAKEVGQILSNLAITAVFIDDIRD